MMLLRRQPRLGNPAALQFLLLRRHLPFSPSGTLSVADNSETVMSILMHAYVRLSSISTVYTL